MRRRFHCSCAPRTQGAAALPAAAAAALAVGGAPAAIPTFHLRRRGRRRQLDGRRAADEQREAERGREREKDAPPALQRADDPRRDGDRDADAERQEERLVNGIGEDGRRRVGRRGAAPLALGLAHLARGRALADGLGGGRRRVGVLAARVDGGLGGAALAEAVDGAAPLARGLGAVLALTAPAEVAEDPVLGLADAVCADGRDDEEAGGKVGGREDEVDDEGGPAVLAEQVLDALGEGHP